MENEKYNGWANRDTWLVMLWLNNDESNYFGVMNILKGVGTNKNWLEVDDSELKNRLKRFHYGDFINWNKVNMDEIRQSLIDMVSE